MVDSLAFRRSKFLIVAERLVIPTDPGSSPGGIQEIVLLRFLDVESVILDLIRDRHDGEVDFNQPILEPLVF